MAPNPVAHREGEEVRQHADGVEEESYDGEQDVGAENAQSGDAAEVAEELLLLHGEPGKEDDGRQEVPVPSRT